MRQWLAEDTEKPPNKPVQSSARSRSPARSRSTASRSSVSSSRASEVTAGTSSDSDDVFEKPVSSQKTKTKSKQQSSLTKRKEKRRRHRLESLFDNDSEEEEADDDDGQQGDEGEESDTKKDYGVSRQRTHAKKRRRRNKHLHGDSNEETEGKEHNDDGGNESDFSLSSNARELRARRNIPLVEIVDELVPVPPLPKRVFPDWKALADALIQYQVETHQAIRTAQTVNVTVRNKEIAKTQAAKNGLLVMYIPLPWKTYKRRCICTHGWRERPRGDGVRTMRFLRGSECPFHIVATLSYVEDQWVVAITASHYFHNHRVAPEVYKTLAENRGIEDASNQTKVVGMMENKRKPKAILQELLKGGENVTLKDVENMVHAYNTEIKTEDDDTACLALLSQFTAANDSNSVSIDETSQHETGVISISSEFMCDMASRFGEMLLVDCTHKTNRYNYQLLTLMIIDDFGQGQVAQHSLLERNADWHMSRALDHFVRINPGVAENVQVIMVDKDLNEIRVLQVYFPHARILICFFHVIKYLKRMVRKPDYGKLSNDDRDTLDAVVHAMVYADTEAIYEENRAILRAVCQAAGYDKFLDYFETNWHSCTEMWVLYKRARLPHFRVHTNNHLESFFGHLKEAVTPSMGMRESVNALIDDDRARANDYTHTHTKVAHCFNHDYDEDMNQLLKFTNPFVARSVETEYKLAAQKEGVFRFEESSTPDVITVHGRTKAHHVHTRTWTCTCSFSKSMKLPCQHAIALRKHRNFKSSIPLKAVKNRYVRR